MDRRKFLIGSGAGIAVAAGLSKARSVFAAGGNANTARLLSNSEGDPQPIVTESNDLTPYPGAWTDTTLRHLLRRAMFGVPLAQFQAAQAMGGMSAVVEKLLTDPPPPAEPATYVDMIVPYDQTLAQTDKTAAGQNQQKGQLN